MKKEDLVALCMEERYLVMFNHGGKFYVTDRRVLVRVPSEEGLVEDGSAERFKVDRVDFETMVDGWASKKPDLWIDCPDVQHGEKTECDICNGKGVVDTDIFVVGEEECPECNGKGFFYEYGSTKIEGYRLNNNYLARLKKLPGIKLGLYSGKEMKSRPILFKFDGGGGVLMPMKPDEDMEGKEI